MLAALFLVKHMLGVQSFNDLYLLATTTAALGRFLACAFGFEKSGSRLWTLTVSSPVAIFTAVPTLRSSFLLFNLVPIQLHFGV